MQKEKPSAASIFWGIIRLNVVKTEKLFIIGDGIATAFKTAHIGEKDFDWPVFVMSASKKIDTNCPFKADNARVTGLAISGAA